MIPINTVILTLNLYMYMYYLYYIVNVMVIKIDNVSIYAFSAILKGHMKIHNVEKRFIFSE